MKLKLLIAFAVTAASTGISMGAIASVTNLSPSPLDLPLIDSAGNALPNGNFGVALGNYGAGSLDPSDPTAGFQVWESTLTAGTAAFGSPNGFVTQEFQQSTGTSGDFIGQPIFALITYVNGSGIAEYAVWQGPALLDDDQVAGESTTSVALQTGSGSLQYGTLVTAPSAGYGGDVPDAFFAQAIQLQAVPEPSSALLLGLGGLGLLIRRKR